MKHWQRRSGHRVGKESLSIVLLAAVARLREDAWGWVVRPMRVGFRGAQVALGRPEGSKPDPEVDT